jgi:hypothetical protein
MVDSVFVEQLLIKDKKICKILSKTDDMACFELINKPAPSYITWEHIYNIKQNFIEFNIINDATFELYTTAINRSKSQTLYLLDLLYGDYDLLIHLEEKTKNNFLHYSPSNILSVIKIFLMKDKISDYNYDIYKNKKYKYPLLVLIMKILKLKK